MGSLHPNMKIIATQTLLTRAAAQRVMENIIQAKGSDITAVYTHNDEVSWAFSSSRSANEARQGCNHQFNRWSENCA